MKFIVTIFVLLALLIDVNLALDAKNYTDYIEELTRDGKFLEEYTKWSFELFSQPDYLYGESHKQFPCPIENMNSSIPTSVHTLRPNDIKCIAAMGGSLTAGLGAHAVTPNGLLSENRGISWSAGGDYTYSNIISIPNILRQYNPTLKGYSTKVSAMFLNGQNAVNSQLNVAKTGDHSIDMPAQAELLIDRLKTENLCDWTNDWKMITFFAGGNDLCTFCEDSDLTKHTPEQYMIHVRDTLDKLFTAPIPRTLVNLVLVPDVRDVKLLSNGNFVCQVLNKRTCPCAAFPTVEQAKILDDYIPRYHKVLLDLIGSGRYDTRDDFTVVIQPFMAKTQIPYRANDKIDFSYFAPDCFHFSGKGHSQAALSLWNNMLEPVGGKQWTGYMGEALKCPTKQNPYIFTSKNSAKAVVDMTVAQSTNRISTVISSTSKSDMTATYNHRQRKSHSESLSKKMKYIAFSSFLLISIMLLIWGFTKRQNVRVFTPKKGRHRFDGINNTQYPVEDDEVEVWARPDLKSTYSDDNRNTTTHGTRIALE